MALDLETLQRDVNAAHAEALRVHDSPVRSDRVQDQIRRLTDLIERDGDGDERGERASRALADAFRVLRLDDDGREAAKHIQKAIAELRPRAAKPSPFLDDL